jgi:hypothetical protein
MNCEERIKSQDYKKCSREGKLVQQFVNNFDGVRYVFRHYLCRYHKAPWNRNKLSRQRKLEYIDFIPDEQLLKEHDDKTIL